MPATSVDWKVFLQKLTASPDQTHFIRPPCPKERIQFLEKECGTLPPPLLALLQTFNGARLFIDAVELVTIFGVSIVPPLPEKEWPPTYHFDYYVPKWRTKAERKQDWPFALMNYGGLVLLTPTLAVKEWDTEEKDWVREFESLDAWNDEILVEGKQYLAEQ